MAGLEPGASRGTGSPPAGAADGEHRASGRHQQAESLSSPAPKQQPETGVGREGTTHAAPGSTSGGGGAEGSEGAAPGSGSSCGGGRGSDGGGGGSGGGGAGPGPGSGSGGGGGGGGDGDASNSLVNRYPTWLRAWLIACGAVYLLLLRPRLFAERDERKRTMEREAAEFAKYEQDWDRLVASYQAKEEEGAGKGKGKGGKAKPSQPVK